MKKVKQLPDFNETYYSDAMKFEIVIGRLRELIKTVNEIIEKIEDKEKS